MLEITRIILILLGTGVFLLAVTAISAWLMAIQLRDINLKMNQAISEITEMRKRLDDSMDRLDGIGGSLCIDDTNCNPTKKDGLENPGKTV